MKIFLVGGAVRDQLLKYPVKEKDWVVVGGNPQTMLQQGFQQVGRDFPVFLHPKTREEYALARTERKQGSGYYGFVCHYDPGVTLEEDLARRDLTINAMAMDEQGQLHDPYGGLADLQAKKLRHVSSAFQEDPVRVLRAARFAARYHHLGFTLADETRALMYRMLKQGELSHLVPERVWQEWESSLLEKNPEVFITTLRSCGALSVIIPELDALFGVPNPRDQHPEVDSGIHSLQSLQAAVKLSSDPMVRFASLVHDVGKGLTPMGLWPHQSQHDALGVDALDKLCKRLRIPADYRKFVMQVSKWHLLIHRVDALTASMCVEVLEKTDAFRRPQLFEKLLLVCQAAAHGTGHPEEYAPRKIWLDYLTSCSRIGMQDILDKAWSGEAIKGLLHRRRVNCINMRMKHEK